METIRTSLQQAEWVTSINFKDAYFHIPIQEQSRKYLRFHTQGRTYLCRKIILIAPRWPNVPWFWDLLTMSSQIPLSLANLPNLLIQPFSQIPHKNLTNLNLHAWLLESQLSRSRASLRQWQQELRLLREAQPDQSMRQSGTFFQNGASLIRLSHPL